MVTERPRPLLIPSPRTPSSAKDLPSLPVLSNSVVKVNLDNPSLASGMDSSNPIESSSSCEISFKSASRSLSSNPSRASRGNSVRTGSFRDLGSRPVRLGSRGGDSEMFSASQKEISDEDARLVYLDDPAKSDERFEFAGNSIRTSKYSIISFIPRNLFEQFHRVAYIYFLIIAVLNQLPQLAVFGRGASILPLAFVLLVTAVKDAYEDWRRHMSDRIENNRLAWVLVNDQFQQKKWKDIQVGEIIKIQANDTLPCDMVLLSTSDSTGVAYVQTINLDGESNLKTRYAKQDTLSKIPEKEKISGLIKCEKPNRNIYGFQANMDVDGKRLSLGPSNIILRGCELKNTVWAIGVAVYCGRETKAMLNSSGAPSKRSWLESRMNSEIIVLSVFLIALCTVVSVSAAVWLRRHRDELDTMPFYRRKDFSDREPENYKYYGWVAEILFTFLMSVIVFQIMIPISLYISMELIRVGQAYLMIRDTQMYDEASNSRFQCRALNINEDLGQIKYVFSDKTGTLTENKMEFQCASVWGTDYSDGKVSTQNQQVRYSVKVEGRNVRPKMSVKVDPQLLELSKSGRDTEEAKHVHDFFLALAACNTIVPLIVDDKSDPTAKLMDYQGESPDEQALAYAAAAYGFMLIERTSGHIIIDIHGERQRFNVFGLHEFDSDRKRMSVILGCPDSTVRVFVKGADTSMFSVIDRSLNTKVVRATEGHLHTYSTLGLRTLVIGMRDLSDSEFEDWHFSFEAASTAVVGRAALLRKVASNVERNLTILGASAIEDKLQQGVPESIESLRTAGIKVWVLTGDKQETAISIGYSSKLLTNKMTQIIINSNSRESCRRCLEDALVMSKKLRAVSETSDNTGTSSEAARGSVALIIDGTSLVYILDNELEEQLFQLASTCSVVLCCRVAPLQKAGIVALVKKRTSEMTLSIGDVHDNKGFNVLLCTLCRYALFACFTLTTAINEWSSMLYSIIYTSLPTIVVAILDKDLSRRNLLKYPQLYGAGQRQEAYNRKLFWLKMLDTVWQSLVVFFVPIFAYWASTIDVPSIGDLWTLAVVILVNLHLAMDIIRWNWIFHAVIWGSIVATFICVMILDAFPMFVGYWAIFHIMGEASFWVCLLGIIIAALLPRFVVKVLYQHFTPDDLQIAREVEKFGHQRDMAVEVEMNPIMEPPPRR
ncbi:hypothetical protein H0E87_020018 [Populus deltoides]|uniref:Phospholipid-transporting ATPase n=1 Tax=Populus deltoides TaxID=3696 RepID=A0A8T2XXK7_POPDE|nr:hypothetical protein H0E87_020018 [Populus deltoides]